MATIDVIKLKDIEKRRVPSKHYAYIIDVTWSDGKVLRIGRAYSDFFNFQGIAKMPRHIIEDGFVENFFRQNPDDKANLQDKKSSPDKTGGRANTQVNEITGPLVLDKYIAVADYTKENKKELNLKSGQVLEVVEKSVNGWWLAANEEGMNGWVPAAYLEPLYGESPSENKRVKSGDGEMFEGITDFSADSVDEISFKAGDLLEVLEKNLEGWWYAKNGNEEGWVPATFLQKSSAMSPKSMNENRPGNGEQLNKFGIRRSLAGTMKPPPKRSTIRRTLTKATVAKVQVDFKEKYMAMFENEQRANSAGIKEEDEDEELNEMYTTIDKFDSTIPDGLSFLKNQTVHVIRKSSEGWWYGRIGNKRGWVPESYLSPKSSTTTLTIPNSPVGTNPRSPSPTSPIRSPIATAQKPVSPNRNGLPPPPAGGKPRIPEPMKKSYQNNTANSSPYPYGKPKTPEPAPKPVLRDGNAGSALPSKGLKPTRPPAPKLSPAISDTRKLFAGSTPSKPQKSSTKPISPQRGVGAPLSPVQLQNGRQQRKSPGVSPFKEIDLTEFPWYRDVSRQEAEDALRCEGQEGYFIVRPSARGKKKDKPYSLTLHHQQTNWNFHIRRRPDDKYAIGIYKESEASFPTLPGLVNHYKSNPLIIGEDERMVFLIDSPQELYSAC